MLMTNQKISMHTGWRSILNDMGVDAGKIFQQANLPENFISLFDLNLSAEQFFKFWQIVEDETKNPMMPLIIMSRVKPVVFHSPMFAALCSANLMQAMQRLAKYQQIMMPMILEIEVSNNGDMTLTPRWHEALSEVPKSLACAGVAFFLKLARLGTKTNIVPLKVTLSALPDAEYVEQFETFFGVGFTQTRSSSITFSAIDTLKPFLTENDEIWKVFEPILRNRNTAINFNTSVYERVKANIIDILPSSNMSIDTISERLAISKRSLQRKLCEEGVTFRSTLNDARKMLAEHYLANTKLTGIEISALLGFENPNSFYRAFLSWMGSTPEEFRKETVKHHR